MVLKFVLKFVLFAIKMEHMVAENFIYTEDSIPLVIITDKTVNCFVKIVVI